MGDGCIYCDRTGFSFMLACERCERWFHYSCINNKWDLKIKRAQIATCLVHYYCYPCRRANPNLKQKYDSSENILTRTMKPQPQQQQQLQQPHKQQQQRLCRQKRKKRHSNYFKDIERHDGTSSSTTSTLSSPSPTPSLSSPTSSSSSSPSSSPTTTALVESGASLSRRKRVRVPTDGSRRWPFF